MRILFFILINIFILTTYANASQVQSKQTLIKKANKNDVQAMLELNKIYLFPQTKEGVDFYTKWYDLVLKSKDTKDIIAFANVYGKYQDMFSDGIKNYIVLLNKAIKLGNKEAVYMLIDKYVTTEQVLEEVTNNKELKKNFDDAIKSAKEQRLIDLYTKYLLDTKTTSYERLLRARLTSKLIKQLNFKAPNLDKLLELDTLYNTYDMKKVKEKADEIYALDDYNLLVVTADFFYGKYKADEGKKFYEKALKIDTTDVTKLDDTKAISYYYNKAKIYEAIQAYKTTQNEDLIVGFLQKAALLDSYDATKELLEIYLKNVKYKDAYLALEKKLLNLNESKRALADYLFNNRDKEKAMKILNELAKKGNENAMIELAIKPFKKKSTSPFSSGDTYGYYDPDVAVVNRKWQKIILNSNKPYLISKLRNAIGKSPILYKEYTKLREKIETKEIKEKNILTLRDLYEQNKINDNKLARNYLNQAIKLGDVKSGLILAQADKIEKNKKPGGKEYFIAKMYESGMFGKIDNRKAMYYYKASAKLGYPLAYMTLGIYYRQTLDHAIAIDYFKKCVALGEGVCYAYMAKYYEEGYIQILKKDMNKALEYYKKSYELDKNKDVAKYIAKIYEIGKGSVKSNSELAKQWYEKANIEKAK